MPSFQSHFRSVVSTTCSLVFLALTWAGPGLGAGSQPTKRPLTLAVLNFGDSNIGRLASEKLASNLKHGTGIVILDHDQVRAAARGAGYGGSINLSLNE